MTSFARFLPYPGIRTIPPNMLEVSSAAKVEYQIDGIRGVLEIPIGFKFDGASTPPLVRLLLAPVFVGCGMTRNDLENAACAHDFCYRKQLGKYFSDRIFEELLRRRARFFFGFARRRRMWGATLATAAVRYFGGAAYRSHQGRSVV